MKDLAQALRDFVLLFERMGALYAVMGGIAVRVYGIPRPRRRGAPFRSLPGHGLGHGSLAGFRLLARHGFRSFLVLLLRRETASPNVSLAR
jgi:hypothetical protein